MKIDHYKIKKEAEKMGISPYLLIKRKLNYRKCRPGEIGCKICRNLVFADNKSPYEVFRKRYCDLIGVGIYSHSEIKTGHICDAIEKI